MRFLFTNVKVIVTPIDFARIAKSSSKSLYVHLKTEMETEVRLAPSDDKCVFYCILSEFLAHHHEADTFRTNSSCLSQTTFEFSRITLVGKGIRVLSNF